MQSNSRRTFVLDTSVLLSDPRALVRFDEHDVVVPVLSSPSWKPSEATPNSAISPAKRCG